MGTDTDTKEQDVVDKIKATIIMVMNGHVPPNRRPLLLRILVAGLASVVLIMFLSSSRRDVDLDVDRELSSSSFRAVTKSILNTKAKPIPRTTAYRCPSEEKVNYNGKLMSQRGEDKQLLHTFGFDQVCGGSYIESK